MYSKRVFRFAVFVIVVSSVLENSLAQTAFWQQMNGLEGGKIVALTLDSSGYIYAAAYAGGVYRSIDNGSNWVNISQNIPDKALTALAVSPNGGIYAATRSIWDIPDMNCDLYRSTNQGNSWIPVLHRIRYVSCVHVTNRGDIVVANDSVGYLRSTDNGASWLFGGVLGRRVNCLISKSDTLVFAATDSGVFRATVSAGSWHPAGLSLTRVSAINVDSSGNLIAGSSDGGIFLSSNHGSTWSRSNVGTSQNQIRSIAVRSANVLIAGTNEGVFRSSDAGRNWLLASSSPRSAAAVLTNAVSFEMAGTDSGVFIAALNGTTWQPSNVGLKASRIFSLKALEDGSILAGTGGVLSTGWLLLPGGRYELGFSFNSGTMGAGVYRTTDNGSQWSAYNLGEMGGCWSIAKGANGGAYAATDSGIFRYSPSTFTWSKISHSFNAYQFTSIIRLHSGTLLTSIWGPYNLYRSTDDGISWTHLLGSPQVLGDALALHPNGDVFAGSNSCVDRSTDQGYSWENRCFLTSIRTCKSIAFNSSGHIFAAFAGAGLYRSTDLGTTWSRLTNGITDTIVNAVAINSEDKIFVGTSTGVSISINNGDSWQQVNTGLTIPYINCLTFDSQGYLYAGTYGGGLFRTTQRTTGIAEKLSNVPAEFSLLQNYPNPFNPSTTIEFALPKSTRATLKVFDLLGREVATLVDENLAAGVHTAEWNASSFSSGVYLYQLKAGNFVQTKKLLLLR